MDAVWASPAAGKGPRKPSGWLSTVGATACREGALLETPLGELTQENYRTEPVPHGWVSAGLGPRVSGSRSSGSLCPGPAPHSPAL